jgi:hypothetical protein
VTIHNLFLSTKAEIDVVDRLYSKVLNIAEALEDVKNVLGKTLREL